jgi:hypothetical protein
MNPKNQDSSPRSTTPPVLLALLPALLCCVLLSGCFSVFTTQEHRNFALSFQDVQEHGIAFITPSSITGQEQDRQALALTFAQVLQEKRPDMRVVTLPETLGILNRADMLADYKEMYEDYADTGIFSRPVLKRISDLAGTRYLAQLKLSGFEQESSERFGVFGLRLLETKRANLRIFLQIWDGQEGEIAWEGYEEVIMSSETFTEKGVMFYDVARTIAERMMANIPQDRTGKN